MRRTPRGRTSWHAHLIVNLSVCAGRYHPPPADGVAEMAFEVAQLLVHRPSMAGDGL
ncbi:hypothetical protein ACFWD7_37485 [Streptomyces mirabilis]|uniref:hypothetical protein n=1 Tax=Streptomyces TaxID=1883 RepID=UPI000F228AA3